MLSQNTNKTEYSCTFCPVKDQQTWAILARKLVSYIVYILYYRSNRLISCYNDETSACGQQKTTMTCGCEYYLWITMSSKVGVIVVIGGRSFC